MHLFDLIGSKIRVNPMSYAYIKKDIQSLSIWIADDINAKWLVLVKLKVLTITYRYNQLFLEIGKHCILYIACKIVIL